MIDVTVVIGTYDPYKPAWGPMCHGLTKYWSDCPWPVEWITVMKRAPCGTTHAVGYGDDWSRRMMRGVERVRAPVILWMTEDNWLTAPVDTAVVKRYAAYVERKALHHIRLYPGWDHDKPDGVTFDKTLLPFAEKSPYRAALKPGLFNRPIFRALLRGGETPWQFERFGSQRSRQFGKLFCAIKEWGCFPFVTAANPDGLWVKSPVHRGKWTDAARVYVKREGLDVNMKRMV